MLTDMKSILLKAKKGGYAVAAPNAFDRFTLEAIFEVASEFKTPIIIDVGGVHAFEGAVELSKFYSNKYPKVESAINLDHGGSWNEIMKALQSGFTSVMVDRSTLSFEENIKEVIEVVKVAHAMGVSVEAELGHVGQGFDYKSTREMGLTRKDEAVEFIKRTNIDCLAVAVGTSHGTYKGVPNIDFKLLQELNSLIDIPLVLHGGSGTGDKNLQKAIKIGIQKINLFTDLSNAAIESVKKYLMVDNPNIYELNLAIKNGYKEKLIHYIKLFGSIGKSR